MSWKDILKNVKVDSNEMCCEELASNWIELCRYVANHISKNGGFARLWETTLPDFAMQNSCEKLLEKIKDVIYHHFDSPEAKEFKRQMKQMNKPIPTPSDLEERLREMVEEFEGCVGEGDAEVEVTNPMDETEQTGGRRRLISV